MSQSFFKGHHVLLVLSWVGLFVLLCDEKVIWILSFNLPEEQKFRLVPYITSYSSRCRGTSVKYLENSGDPLTYFSS